ncbi:hypothetical protein PPERSA_07767 [Pseudocohnilembus persalinus]|uniref:Uncharacterized protein n=1 Tax=Pseudocohnilembus persalinus TaxID=266149 RepID=A0A0V0RAF8_PSEPJ|nr:hypothetical protein PPERSA_07767 [Pseudocohnilembus persalinus]|eukprot:KRX11242.1 hypothetical protein PPERSA_07767 [Pseudocohnilembus persalinus]
MIWYKYRETFSQKIQRWCFSKDYRVPESIQEQRFDKLHLKPETIDKLSVFYQKNDKILQLGITRKYLCRVYKDLGLFTKPDDKFGFYQFSGYGKKRNQQKASVNLYQFLHLFNEALKKQNYIEQKNENYITKFLNKLSGKKYVSEDEFCLKFLQALESNLESMKQWEIGNIQKQVQYKNFGIQMKEQKNKIIQETLTNEPMVKLEDINKELSKHGFLELNAKEKIVILHRQKAYLILHENNFKDKLENSLDSSKQFKYKQRMEEINEKLKTINSQIDLYSKQFKELFPGQKVFLYEKDQEEDQKQEK